MSNNGLAFDDLTEKEPKEEQKDSLSSDDVEKIISIINLSKEVSTPSDEGKMSKFLKWIPVVITIGAIIWGAAMLTGNKADKNYVDKKHDAQEQRIIQIEKNDIRQTTILENIDEKVDQLLGK